jgi:hypothetical protein
MGTGIAESKSIIPVIPTWALTVTILGDRKCAGQSVHLKNDDDRDDDDDDDGNDDGDDDNDDDEYGGDLGRLEVRGAICAPENT